VKKAWDITLPRGLLAAWVALISIAADDRTRGQDQREVAPGAGVPVPPGERVEVGGVPNLYRLSPRLYSGGQPEVEGGLASLKRLGIGTIISVDGALPQVEEARRLGIRYVHLPVGYDGLPREQVVDLIRAVRTLPGPVFVHCHHGKHRGPTAAAVCGMATEGWSKERARLWMERAGTSPDYRGLFATVEGFREPTPEELAARVTTLPERAKVPALVTMMVRIDETFDHLKLAQKAGFRAPLSHPDLDPPHEALMLVELLREVRRHHEASAKGEEFLRQVGESERQAAELQRNLRGLDTAHSTGIRERAEAAFMGVGKGCTSCHARFRDNRAE